MKRWQFLFVLAGALLLVTASAAHAELSKLDPLARIALARLHAGDTPQALGAEGRLSVSSAGELDVFIVGDVSRAQLEAAGARVRTALPGIFTAWIPVDRVEAVSAIAGVSHIEGAQVAEINNDLGSASTGATLLRGPGPTFTGVNGAGVIVGNVDTGVDYDHDNFKDAFGNTRILKIWDQKDLAGPNPAGFGYGSEWNSASINSLASRAGDTNGHGSHTMGTAAGDGSAVGTAGSAPAFTYTGMAPKADIIAVDGSVSGSFSSTQMADGINYIFQQATAFGKSAVVNCSIGGQFGPKDGTGTFEAAADLLSGPGRIVVMSSGNDRGQPLHAEWHPGDPAVTMFISSTATSARFVGLNGYYEATEQLNVTVTTPIGNVVGPIAVGGISGPYPGPLTGNGNVYIENGASLTSTGDKQVYIELNAADGSTIGGTWTIAFTPVVIGASGGEVDLWRFTFNTTNANFLAGNQPNEEIISALATGLNTVAAGAWVTRQFWTDCRATNWNDPTNAGFGQPAVGNIAAFSSPGPTRDGRIKPDVTGPGTAIISVRSTDTSIGPCIGATVSLPGQAHIANQGTSMSAPHVTGAIALLLQKYGPLSPAQVQTQLHNRAMVDGFVTAFGAAPNKDFGWGKLNLGDMTDPLCTVTIPNGGEAYSVGGHYSVRWNASDAVGVTAVDIELSRNNGGVWENVALGVPNTGSYTWTVTGPTTASALLRVTARDASLNAKADVSNAVWTINSGPLAVGDQDRPVTEFTLESVSPSPAPGRTMIEYAVPRAADVSVVMFDLQGRERVTLASGHHAPGRYRVQWDGEVDGGLAHAGVYFVRLSSPGVSKTTRFVVSH